MSATRARVAASCSMFRQTPSLQQAQTATQHANIYKPLPLPLVGMSSEAGRPIMIQVQVLEIKLRRCRLLGRRRKGLARAWRTRSPLRIKLAMSQQLQQRYTPLTTRTTARPTGICHLKTNSIRCANGNADKHGFLMQLIAIVLAPETRARAPVLLRVTSIGFLLRSTTTMRGASISTLAIREQAPS